MNVMNVMMVFMDEIVVFRVPRPVCLARMSSTVSYAKMDFSGTTVVSIVLAPAYCVTMKPAARNA